MIGFQLNRVKKVVFRSDPPCDSICDSICDNICDRSCDRICDSICDSNFGPDRLHYSIQFNIRSNFDLCVYMHRSTLVCIYIYEFHRIHNKWHAVWKIYYVGQHQHQHQQQQQNQWQQQHNCMDFCGHAYATHHYPIESHTHIHIPIYTHEYIQSWPVTFSFCNDEKVVHLSCLRGQWWKHTPLWCGRVSTTYNLPWGHAPAMRQGKYNLQSTRIFFWHQNSSQRVAHGTSAATPFQRHQPSQGDHCIGCRSCRWRDGETPKILSLPCPMQPRL